MTKKLLFLMLLIGLTALFMFGCGEADSENDPDPVDIDNPQDIDASMADWLLVFGTGDYGKTPNAVMMYYLKATNLPLPTDAFTLEVDGFSIPLEAYMGIPGFYYTTYDLTEGSTYDVVVKKNGTILLDTTQKMVYGADVTFPSTFSPGAPATMNWTMAANNQYQYAGVSAYKDNYPNDPTTDEFFVQLAVSARSYTIPANSVDDLGANTDYNLGVEQLNYHIVNRFAVMSFYEDFEDYGGIAKADRMTAMLHKAVALHKAVNR